MNKKLFTYPSFGSPVGFPELKERSGQVVEVIEKLTRDMLDEEIEDMFLVRFSDGFEVQAFSSELSDIED